MHVKFTSFRACPDYRRGADRLPGTRFCILENHDIFFGFTKDRSMSKPLHDPLSKKLDQDSRIEVRTTTCYMCACRCGIRVTLRGS
jgi:hypothetical protein